VSKKLEEVQRQHQAELDGAIFQIEQLQESLANVVMAIDDIGWRPLGDDVDATEIPLDSIKETAQTTRGVLTLNPLIRRAIAVRTSYIWGQGWKFEGISENDPILTNVKNRKWVFSEQAVGELEACVGTDGNLFALLTRGRTRAKGRGTVERVPMKQIVGTVTNPENNEDIWFYKRQWDYNTVNYTTQNKTAETRQAYYPADDYDLANGRPSQIAGVPVNWDSAILHVSGSKQTGWKWGVPDLMSVVFWTKAYKEYLETMMTLTKAYARFAWKVQASSVAGVNSVASKVQATPTRHPITNQPMDVGGTAGMTAGMNLQAVGRSSNSVDFGGGLPLAAMIAAGLEIPLTTLTSDAGSANRSGSETLSEPTIKAMEMRQKLWSNFYERMFAYFGKTVRVVWPKIETEPTLKKIQAIVSALPANVLHDQEVRDYIVEALGLDNDNKLPTEEELGLLILEMNKQAEAAEKAATEKAKLASANASYGDHQNREQEGARQYEPGTYGKQQ
jgi:hypothetical protein